MDSSISIPLDLSGLVPPSLSSLAPPLPLVQRKPAAEVVAPPVARGRMQPHIGYALLLTLGYFMVLMLVNVAWSFVAIAVVLSQGQEITPSTLFDFGAANSAAVLLTLFMASCVYGVGTAAIAFRGQMVERLSIRKITRTQLAIVVMLTLPLAMVISSIAVGLMSLLGIDATNANIITDPSNLAIALFSIAVLPAIGEEVFFRGLLSRGLIARHGVILGVLFATFLFALLHGSPVQIIAIFFMGLVMQLVFLWTRSLLASMLLHCLYNATIVIIARNAPAEAAAVTNASFVLALLVSLLAIAALLTLLYQTRTRWQLPDGNFWSPGYVATDMPPRDLRAVAVNANGSMLLKILALVSFVVLLAMT